MALSFANRRRGQTSSKSWAVQKQASIAVPNSGTRHHQHQQQQQQQFAVRKQYSFIETPSGSQRYTSAQRAYLTRGISVDRSIESLRQRLYTSGEQPKLSTGVRLSRQASVDATKLTTKNVTVKQLSSIQHSKTNGNLSKNTALSNAISAKLKDRNLVAWSSTSSLLKTLDNEIDDVNKSTAQENANSGSGCVDVENLNKNKRNNIESAKADSNRINLNIVLSQTIRATNEHEIAHSDIESSTDCGAEVFQSKTLTDESSVAQRRAQFQQSRNLSGGCAVASSTLNNNNNSNNNTKTNTQLSISPALTVQRRPPLVRAMSAPVRSLDDNSKSVIAANKRQHKLRRRKILTRNVSCDKSGATNDNDVISSTDGNKKVLARSRTVATPDVLITLVSLLSSEGSDSEREDNTSTTNNSNGKNEQSPTRRAPLLRKTGKSVSFQDGYPAAFQLASKEYSHMLRRGSIAPLAARLRSNRPPTAPPVSIFLSDAQSTQQQTSNDDKNKPNATASMTDCSNQPKATHNEKENDAANCNVQAKEYDYPEYVRSIKERECWKLFQKMSAKGVNVSYDTILRGMLTPTEFRQLQKQRDLEEAKAQEALNAAEPAEKPKAPPTAIERLSESLLNNQK